MQGQRGKGCGPMRMRRSPTAMRHGCGREGNRRFSRRVLTIVAAATNGVRRPGPVHCTTGELRQILTEATVTELCECRRVPGLSLYQHPDRKSGCFFAQGLPLDPGSRAGDERSFRRIRGRLAEAAATHWRPRGRGALWVFRRAGDGWSVGGGVGGRVFQTKTMLCRANHWMSCGLVTLVGSSHGLRGPCPVPFETQKLPT